jgi:hypothetical protein
MGAPEESRFDKQKRLAHKGHPLLLANRFSTHNNIDMMSTSILFRRELRLLCILLFGVPPYNEQHTTDYIINLIKLLHDFHHYAFQLVKTTSNMMKAHYKSLPNSAGFQEGHKVWLHRQIWTKVNMLKVPPS